MSKSRPCSYKVVAAPKKAAANWLVKTGGGTKLRGFKKKSAAKKFAKNRRKRCRGH